MQKYYIHNGVVKEGPFNLQELESKSITKYTPVWDHQSNQWTAAQNIKTLQVFFEKAKLAILPPDPKRLANEEVNQTPKKRKKYIEVLIIAGIVVLVTCLYAYAVLPQDPAAAISKSYRLR